MVGLADVGASRQPFETLAIPTGQWHHQIRYRGKARAFARSSAGAVDQLAESVLAEKIDAAIEFVDAKLPGNGVARLLVVPAYYVHAFWIHSPTQDDVVVIDRPEGSALQYQHLYRADEFLQALAGEAHSHGIGLYGAERLDEVFASATVKARVEALWQDLSTTATRPELASIVEQARVLVMRRLAVAADAPIREDVAEVVLESLDEVCLTVSRRNQPDRAKPMAKVALPYDYQETAAFESPELSVRAVKVLARMKEQADPAVTPAGLVADVVHRLPIEPSVADKVLQALLGCPRCGRWLSPMWQRCPFHPD
jgi:hypothetical protein